MRVGVIVLFAWLLALLHNNVMASSPVVETDKKAQPKWIQDNVDIYPIIQKSLEQMLDGNVTGLVEKREFYPVVYIVKGYDLQDITKTVKSKKSTFYRVEFAFDVEEKINQGFGKTRRTSMNKRLEAIAFLQKEGKDFFWSGRLKAPYVSPDKEKPFLLEK